jgi:Ca2+-binding RTX toxin-like protein
VVFGKAGGTKVELSDIASGTSTLGFVINGATAVDQSGYSVSSAGDVNGDGLDDLIVGAFGADPNENSYSGASYVVFGKTDGTKVELSAIVSGDGTKGFVINGAVLSDQSARSVSSAGDVNGDGFDDLIVGAGLADPNGSNSGSSYVVFGGNFTGSVSQLGTTGNDTLSGTAANDVILGGRGDDVITGNGGIDRLAGGTGNDTLIISNANFGRVDGGADIDTLRLAGAFTLDLSALAAVAIKDIEVIDLVAGSLNNILTVTRQTLMNLSTTTNRLMVLGGSGDTVNAFGFTLDTGTITDKGITYTTYTNGAAKLWVQQGVNVVTTPPPPGGFVLTGVDGHDMLIVGDANFLRVDGGAGTDILPMAATSGFGLDLSTLTPGAINDIEPIDLVAEELNNMLTITQQTLLDFSTTSDHLTFTQSGSGDTQIGLGADTSMMVEGYLPAKLTDFLTSTPSSLIVL